MKNGLTSKISEYFFGTETKRFYDYQIAQLTEFSLDERHNAELKEHAEKVKRIYIGGKYIHNIASFLGLAGITVCLATDSWGLYGSIGLLISSEVTRIIGLKADRNIRNTLESNLNHHKTLSRIDDSIEEIKRYLKKLEEE